MSFVSCYNKLSNLRSRLWEPFICNQVEQKYGNLRSHFLRLASEVGEVLWDWTLKLLDMC